MCVCVFKCPGGKGGGREGGGGVTDLCLREDMTHWNAPPLNSLPSDAASHNSQCQNSLGDEWLRHAQYPGVYSA